MRRLLLVALGVVATFVLAACMSFFAPASSDDEAPIHVKNGSLLLELGDSSMADRGKWVPDPPTSPAHYTHDPRAAGVDSDSRQFYVKVVLPTGSAATCSVTPPIFTGNQVRVSYSNNIQANFHRAGSGNRMRTQVDPVTDLKQGNENWLLRYDDPDPGNKGHIEQVQVAGNKCTFPSGGDLTEILICAGPGNGTCK